SYYEIGLGPTSIACALLHDVVEDTEVTIDEITYMFGSKISKIVDGLTKLDGLYNVDSPQAENYKKVLSTLVYDVRVVLIKMADRLHNLRTIGSMPRYKQLRIAAETSYIYVPLAHRLGLYNIKKEFEDIIFKISEPEKYEEINNKLKDSQKQRDKYISKFIEPLKDKLKELGVPYRVLGRPKSISSIYNKIKNKNVTFDEIYDLFAVRIIVDVPREKEKSTCWQVYSLITDVYTPIPERLKDWVTNPKSNGYESLHTTIIGPQGKFVEIQIRSERMDEIAEKGFAAHWKYKGNETRMDVYDRWLDNIRDLLDNSSSSDALEFISDFKTNLFKEEIYAFTPKGDMRILPKGATALDFAFDIHSDVGYRAVAIKVNNKLVPMGYKLNNGDKVSVMTGKNQKPNENWLKLVVTGKAKSKIRSSMKEERRKQGELGKETLERKLRKLKVDFLQNIDMLVEHYGYKSRPDFYFAIANEKVDLSTLKQFDVVGQKLVKREMEQESKVLKNKSVEVPIVKQNSVPLVYINGEPGDKYNYTFAKCCNPIQGDDIFGFITSNSGLKIHRNNCPNAMHLLANFGYRVVKAEWGSNISTNFVVDLLIIGIDSGPGVIKNIINKLSDEIGINIRSFNISGEEGYFEGRISIFVKNHNQVNLIIRKLKEIDGINSVERIDKQN
ncbi:MAG TPA: bifunctional (p)ppGpp synthetase/guanosine-3',5'-bis(diphosphate) 3'-pyrophosphohydrolase, partial [Bacteroidetes bacterium]|nr:bifunctional (p)ppGpp synthetase/guanosine-3',5'-bis(diphosphate) 3'-pyrophosphohydrolase [Bacteroidota bacterium]